jgi:hypothetical protein
LLIGFVCRPMADGPRVWSVLTDTQACVLSCRNAVRTRLVMLNREPVQNLPNRNQLLRKHHESRVTRRQ